MRTITFTEEDRKALAHDRYHHPDPRVRRKMEVLWLKSHGLTHDQIATYADVSRSTICNATSTSISRAGTALHQCHWHQPRRPGRVPVLPGGVLPGAPGPLRQAGPGRHRAADGRPPGPQPGPPLPQGQAGASPADKAGAIPVPPEEDGRGARASRPSSCRSSWSRDWRRPVRATGRCYSWTPPTSSSAVPGVPSARRGSSFGRHRVASGTTSWGRSTR